jgi:nicotinate-nucleotide adenylyltransferase
MSERTIALFGGSFNPPHVAHQMVCLFVLETCDVDELWIVPTYNHAFAKELVDFEHRFAMCERVASAFGGRVVVSDIERQLGDEVSRTLDTIEALYERHPEIALRLVVGADILAETDKWHRWDEVSRLAPPIVIGRGGFDLDPADDQPGLDMPEVSSTEIRQRLRSGLSALPLVPRAVMNYIAEHGLYSS